MKTYTSEQLGQRIDEACAVHKEIVKQFIACGRRACLGASIETVDTYVVSSVSMQELAKLCGMVETHDGTGFEDAPAVQEEKPNLVMGPSGSPEQPGETSEQPES